MLRKIKNYIHFFEALLANIKYDFPSRKLFVIGVTGTDGKTTTSSIIYHILKEAGEKVAMVNTVGTYINNTHFPTGFHVTTPSSFELQTYIQKAAAAGSKYLVLETTSHALDQYRVWGIDYKIAVLTNITHEHLDYHKTYDQYLKTKLRLLQMAPLNIVNADDNSYSIIKPLLKNKQVLTYSLINKNTSINLQKFPFITPLFGDFNKQNCLAAILVAKQLDIPDAVIKKSLSSFRAPEGRQEVVYDEAFKVVVDFAHTPNSLEKILPEAKKKAKNRLIHLFGAAGERDKTKRPLMGKASSNYADIIILTAEDPRSESLDEINQQIICGFTASYKFQDWQKYSPNPKDKKIYFTIPRRDKAIAFATKIAQKGDLVLCTGKGHEKSINYGQGEEAWDEKQSVLKATKN